ncbi:MAG TPA: NADH-quinone oxidoreductase subunit M, partial [Chitinophagaceae bacterium]|nr:NADH-quinone oxidoreductase subunit M [Chitinophagaceae bacterium]
SGVVLFFFRNERSAKSFALLASVLTLLISILGLTCMNNPAYLTCDADWMPALGSRFHIQLDGMGQLLCLLTALSFPLIFIATWNNNYKNASRFFALMLLSQAGLIGVFVAMDALLFYFFWELALIPVYFLCSIWGGERRINVTFKFFIYTFAGSLLMLIGLIWIYLNAGQSFSLEAFYSHQLQPRQQYTIFWLLFLAFAIKMPVFPFHTWQPDTYEQSPTAVTMVLSGIMVKMGVFGLLRWVVPVVPIGSWAWGDTVTSLAIIGMLYASLLAIQQDDLKRLVAYSSIAHMGLMCVAIFATTKSGMQGVMIQMFNHGINIIGLWVVVNVIEQRFGTRRISELGGIAQKAPALSILLVIVALGNIALPLTNGFVGEFMMFNGVFASKATAYNIVFTVLALVSIILAAVYTLNMIQKVFYGNSSATVETNGGDISFNVKLVLSVIALLIIVLGVYPKPMLSLTSEVSDFILSKMYLK